MSLQRWILLALLAAAVFAAVVAAQDGDDDEEAPVGQTVQGQTIEEVTEGVDAEDAADELDDAEDVAEGADSLGLKASHWFPKYADLKVPAGERVEVLVPISNAAGNPAYEVALVAGNLGTLDHQRAIQNFSAQVYDRKLEAGQTATIKYTVTPDALLEPSEYSFTVVAYLRTDDNVTHAVTAYNSTMLVQDPLGFDFKGTATFAVLIGAVAYAVWHFVLNKPSAPAASPAKVAAAAVAAEAGTQKKGAYDPDFVDPSHLAYIKAKNGRGRSASPKK